MILPLPLPYFLHVLRFVMGIYYNCVTDTITNLNTRSSIMKHKVKEGLEMCIGALVIFAMVFGGCHIAERAHARTCPVCQDKSHTEVCDKLSRHDKAKFDQEHGCRYFWCPALMM